MKTELSKPNGSAVPPPKSQKEWVLRYKRGNHPAETGKIVASSRERAEEVGRVWCVKQSVGTMASVKYIGVEDPILADESILGDEI